jgi:aminoglycoside phosphotransferase (APT) family kinase protein
LAIVASPGRGAASLIDQVLRQAHSPEDAEPLTVERYCFANPYGLTLIASGGRILRIALSSEAIDRNVTNYDALCALQSNPTVDLGSLPRPITAGSIDSARFFMETAVPGRLASGLIRKERHCRAVVERSIAWIARLHSATVQYQSFDDRRLRQLVLDPLDRAMNVLGAASSIPRFQDFLIHSFAGRVIPLVFSHGDYSLDNIQVDSSFQISGVFDWDLSEPQGLPFLDVFYLFLTVARQRTGQPFGQLFTAQLEGRSGDPTEERLVHEYCQAIQLPSDLIAPLRVMAWLHHVGKRTHNPERYRFTKDAADVAGDALPAVDRWLSSRPHTPEESRYR